MLVRCSSLQFFHQKRTNLFLPYPAESSSWRCDVAHVDIVKGWTRASVVATFLLAASELDLSEPGTAEKLKPLFKVLDRAWMIPCTATWKIFNFKCFLWQKCSHQDFPHFCPPIINFFKNNFCLHNFPRECQINQDGLQHGHGCTFLSQPHLELQRKWAPEPELSPACLEIQQDHGAACSWRSSFGIGFDWGSSPGNRWWVSPKSRAECKASPRRGEVQVRAEHDHWHLPWPLLLELVPINFARLIFWELIFWELILYCCSFFWFIIYTTIKDARAVLQRHIDHVKWKDCAFSTEQLKGQRWMLGSTPKNCPTNLKKALTVSEMAQVLHFKLVIHCYQENGRRLRQSSKSRVRWSGAQFDAHCDLACVYSAALEEARELSHWNSEKEAAVIKALLQKFLGSFFKCFFVGLFFFGVFCSHLQLVESTFTAFQLFLLLLCESLSEGLWSRGGGRCDSKTSNLEGSALGIVGGSHWAPSVSWTCGFSKWADGAWRWSSGSKVQRSAHKAFPGHLSYVQLQQLKGGVHPSFPCGESHAREKPGGGRQRASSQTCSGNCVFLK